MKVIDIIREAENRIPYDIDVNRALTYINDGLVDMATRFETASVMDTTTAFISSGSQIENPVEGNPLMYGPPLRPIKLPFFSTKVKKVIEKSLGSERICTDYELDGNYITFPREAEYEIFYLKVPRKVRVSSDEPEIHPGYVNALIHYVAGSEIHRIFGEENSDSVFLIAKYEKLAEEAHASLISNMKKKRRYIPPMRW